MVRRETCRNGNTLLWQNKRRRQKKTPLCHHWFASPPTFSTDPRAAEVNACPLCTAETSRRDVRGVKGRRHWTHYRTGSLDSFCQVALTSRGVTLVQRPGSGHIVFFLTNVGRLIRQVKYLVQYFAVRSAFTRGMFQGRELSADKWISNKPIT